MEQQHTHDDDRQNRQNSWNWRLILFWAAATTIGLTVAWIIGGSYIIMLSNAIGSFIGKTTFTTVFGAIVGVTGGIGVGIGQWFLLRSHVPSAGWWLPATAAGCLVAGAGWVFVSRFLADITPYAIADIGDGFLVALVKRFLLGLVVGGVQWLVLRHVAAKARRWVLTTGGSFAIALIIGQIVVDNYLLSLSAAWNNWAINGGVVGGIVGLVYGLLSGGAIAWILAGQSAVAEPPTAAE